MCRQSVLSLSPSFLKTLALQVLLGCPNVLVLVNKVLGNVFSLHHICCVSGVLAALKSLEVPRSWVVCLNALDDNS